MSVSLNKYNNWKQANTLTGLPPPEPIICKADTGASSNYVTEKDKNVLSNVESVQDGPRVKLPNSGQIQANKKGILPLPATLSLTARTAHVFSGLTNASLLSIGRLCNDGCVAVFDALSLRIFKKNKLILTGKRNFQDGLWDITLDPPQNIQESMKLIVRRDQTKTKLGEYLHKCAFSPSISTFLKAIRLGFFQSWPSIETINFKKILNNLVPTAKRSP